MTDALRRRVLPSRVDFRPRAVAGVWMRHAVAFRGGWRIETAGIVIEPIFVLTAIAFGIGRLVGDVEEGLTYAVFVAPGVIAGNAMWHALFECSWGAFRRLQTNRIYESMLVAPVAMGEIALGEILWGATRAAMTTAAVLAFAAALGLVDSPAGIAILVVGALTGLMFGGLGLVFAAIAPTTHSLTLVFTMVGSPLFFFSGTFFPINTLPGWLEPLAWALPLSHPVHLARGLTTNELDITHVYSVVYVLVFSLAAYPLATRLLRRRLLV